MSPLAFRRQGWLLGPGKQLSEAPQQRLSSPSSCPHPGPGDEESRDPWEDLSYGFAELKGSGQHRCSLWERLPPQQPRPQTRSLHAPLPCHLPWLHSSTGVQMDKPPNTTGLRSATLACASGEQRAGHCLRNAVCNGRERFSTAAASRLATECNSSFAAAHKPQACI